MDRKTIKALGSIILGNILLQIFLILYGLTNTLGQQVPIWIDKWLKDKAEIQQPLKPPPKCSCKSTRKSKRK
jgi:hypothetical protein